MTQIRLSVSTWNCLADCYIDYSLGEHVGEFEARKVLCRKVLSSMDSDILLMQEVDHWEDFYQPLLHELGFHCSYYQRPGRKDGLVIAAKTSKRLSLMEVEYVSFDDLIERYDDVLFSKQNVGLICRYKHTDEAGEELGRFVIATTHLHWNPARREVKLAQVQYLLERINAFAGSELVILGGDFNTTPRDPLYSLITTGTDISASLEASYARLMGPGTRFLCDVTLLKLCKWLRLLGIDAKMETEESHAARTKKPASRNGSKKGNVKSCKQDFNLLFDMARSEKRVLLTSSKSTRERASCPQSHYISTHDFEEALTSVVIKFKLDIREENFLTVCSLCGGQIETLDVVKSRLGDAFSPPGFDNNIMPPQMEMEMEAAKEKEAVAVAGSEKVVLPTAFSSTSVARRGDVTATARTAGGRRDKDINYEEEETSTSPNNPAYIPTDRPVFACSICHQLYWWNDRSDSSPARAMRVAKKLFDVINEKTGGGGSCAAGGEGAFATVPRHLKHETQQHAGHMSATLYAQGVDEGSDAAALKAHESELTMRFHARNEAVMRKDKELGAGAGAGAGGAAADAGADSAERKGDTNTACRPFVSAFAAVYGREPKTTNWTTSFMDTLDYVFVRAGGGEGGEKQRTPSVAALVAGLIPRMEVNSVAGEEEPAAAGNCNGEREEEREGLGSGWVVESKPQPSEQWPSDHFVVRTELLLSL